MITVLHTESSLGWGGQEKRTLHELAGLSRLNFRPLLACRPGSRIGAAARERGLEVELVRMRGNFDPLAVARLLGLYRRRAVDIVNTHSAADSWMASAAAKLSSRRPAVVRTRHLSCSFRHRLPYQFMADRVVTVGESTRQYMIREKGIRPEKIITIPTGIDLDRFDPQKTGADLREELGIPPEAPVFGTVAVFRFAKGHAFLLEAARKVLASFPAARLLLVGDGPQMEIMRRTVEEKGLQPSVILPGFRGDVERVLKTMDLFVFPSLEEALGTAAMEAMAMEKPVVATRVGGIPEIIEEGRTGFLVEPRDASALAERIIALLANGELRREMGRRGRQFVQGRFDQRDMIRKMEELYLSLAAGRES